MSFALLFVAALQSPSAMVSPSCFGKLAVVRESRLKSEAALPLFLQAVGLHQAWYRSHGYPKYAIKVMTVFSRDADDHRVIAIYERDLSRDANTLEPAPDNAWSDFLNKYRSSSEIVKDWRVCMLPSE